MNNEKRIKRALSKYDYNHIMYKLSSALQYYQHHPDSLLPEVGDNGDDGHLIASNVQRLNRLLPKPPRSSVSPTSSSSALQDSQVSSRHHTPPYNNRNYQEARYKTEICLHFREKNFCPHGIRCLFAHGIQELRPYRGRHPKHKTQKCKSFHETGYCNYGYRCSYIHLESPRTIRYLKSLNSKRRTRRLIMK